MIKNHWTKRIHYRALNKSLLGIVQTYLGQAWTDDLKKLISKLALKFMVDNDLDDDTAFAVVLERGATTGISGATDIFRGIKLDEK
jgi:hypothetical protein